MALSGRQKLFFFVGLNIALYGLALTILGVWLIDYVYHGAAGAAMWCGIILIMCGVGDVIISIDDDSKDGAGTFSMGALLANMIAMLVSIGVIGFTTWASYDTLNRGIIYAVTEPAIEVYVTVTLLAGFSMLLSLIALMFDCCCANGLDLFGANPQQYPGYPAAAGGLQMTGGLPYVDPYGRR